MDAVVNAIYAGFQAFLGAGAYVMLPVIITILGLVFGLKIGKAFKSGVTIAIGFAGINLVVQLMKDQLGPAAKAMVTNFGVQLDVLDVGWGAIASVAWASPIVPFIVFEVLLINIGLLVINKTNTMDVDI
jgi:PTS system galactitol-specific IIC component